MSRTAPLPLAALSAPPRRGVPGRRRLAAVARPQRRRRQRRNRPAAASGPRTPASSGSCRSTAPAPARPSSAAGAVFLTTQEGDDLYLAEVRRRDGRGRRGSRRSATATRRGRRSARRATTNAVIRSSTRCKTSPARRRPPTARWSSPTSATATSPPTTTPANASGIATCRTTTAPTPSGGATPTAPSSTRTCVICACMQDSLADLPGAESESYLRRPRQAHRRAQMADGAQDRSPRPRSATPTPRRSCAHGRRTARQLVVMGGNQLDAYDPDDGRQLWYLPGLVGGRTVGGPTVGDGLVFATRGKKGPMVAVKPDGAGELPEKADRLDTRQGHARQLARRWSATACSSRSWTPASPIATTPTPAI